jgi:hypothetical protein
MGIVDIVEPPNTWVQMQERGQEEITYLRRRGLVDATKV